MTLTNLRGISRRSFLKTSAVAAAGTLAAPSILRAQSSEIVIGCAGSHTAWMEAIVACANLAFVLPDCCPKPDL